MAQDFRGRRDFRLTKLLKKSHLVGCVATLPRKESALLRGRHQKARQSAYRAGARRTAFLVRAFAFIVDVRTARFTLRVVFALAAFAGRVTLV